MLVGYKDQRPVFIYLFIYNNISLGKLSHQSDFQRGPK